MRKVLFGLILGLGMSLLPLSAAHADPVSDEAAFVGKINELRASKGLPALQVNENLVAKARTWAATMAAAGKIWHSTLSDGITADWKKLGENVGMGGSVDGLHAAFVASIHHYENLVDPSFGNVGIGIVMSGKTIYVAEMFMQLMPSKTAPVAAPATTPIIAPLVIAPGAPQVATPTAPKPAALTPVIPKPVVSKPAPKPAAPKSATTAAPVPAAPAAPPTPPVATPPAPAVPAAPAATPAAPADPPRAPSALLVSVLERLRSFDS